MPLTRDTEPGPAHGRGRSVSVARADVGGNPIEIVESSTSRWLFDRARRRFLRLPRDLELDVSVLALPWQQYSHVNLDDDGGDVVVTLADGGLVRLETSGS